MATSDLIAFVRARITDAERIIGQSTETEAYRKIVDEYERTNRHYSKVMSESNSFEKIHTAGHQMGMEHAVVALAGIWSHHPDWRGGWW